MKTIETPQDAFAKLVLSDLNRSWPDFILNAAVVEHIQAASVINEAAAGIDTTNVNDEQILNVTTTFGQPWQKRRS